MGKATDMEQSWLGSSERFRKPSQIPSIVINDENGVQSQCDWVDWNSVAKRIQDFNYLLLKKHFVNNPEFLISNLIFQSFRFFPQFDKTRKDVWEFEDKRTMELDEKLQDINQHAVITDSFISHLNEHVGFLRNDELESLSSIKYSIVIDNIDARRMEAFSNIKHTNSYVCDFLDDHESLVVCINHGRHKNLGYCNVVSTINLKERSYSIQTIKSSHTNDDEVEISVDIDAEAQNIRLNDCFKKVIAQSTQGSEWNLDNFDREWFLSPKIFRHEYITKSLNATLSSFEGAWDTTFTQKYGVIYSTKQIQGGVKRLEAFTPVINVPYDLQDELRAWENRNSKVIEVTKTSHKYQWPTMSDKEFAATMSFNLTPFPRKEMKHLEWQIDMTDLFNRLFKSLSRNQIRAYLFSIAIYKNYEEDLKPLKDVHFKHILFTLVERFPAGPMWFDENLGKAVFHIFDTLRQHLQTKNFPHYFMPKWNLLGHISTTVINSIFSRVHLITENYLEAVVETMSKLEYTPDNRCFTKISLSNIEKFLESKTGHLPFTKSITKKNVGSKTSEQNNMLKNVKKTTRLVGILKEVFRHYLTMVIQSYNLKDMGLYSSLIYTLQNLIKLVEDLDLGMYIPEIHGIKNEIRLIMAKYSPAKPFDYWFHNLANENNLLMQ